MDNDIADHLAGMLASLGLVDVRATEELELTTRGDADFETRMALWPAVIATRGHQIVADGMIEEQDARRPKRRSLTGFAATRGLSVCISWRSARQRVNGHRSRSDPGAARRGGAPA
jgi:hypothetical protein